ncbi:MAG: SusC/RagA family TonB-linked outer membrane protein, partial [Odoribacter sp.]|nr:SusC/RagA family TonB-linked outer membrane protein [Odoribacter sp.]
VLIRHGYDYSIESRVIVIRKQARQEQAEVKRKKVNGTVKDEHGELLPGVTVRIKNTTMGTATDSDGKYTLTFPDGEYTLVFSMVGMQDREELVGKRTEIDVVMQQVAAEIEEVVVTGIFKKAKESYTGAVSTIGKEEILAYRGQNMLQTLRNIDPAFNVVQNNEFGSDPNRLPDITVRGNSSLTTNLKELNEGTKNDLNVPLIIMDDFEISLTKLMDYNEEEIESINILKDAAATAIYGSRGANGVVVIVSKKPQAGKLKVFAQAGMILEIPDLTSYDLMNARDKLRLEWEAGLYNHATNPGDDVILKQAYYKRLKAVAEGVETDWLSQPLHTGVGQNYNLRFEGGSEAFRWSASLGYKDIQGAMIGSNRKTFSGGVMLSYSYKNLIFRNQTSIGSNKSEESPYGSFSNYARQQPYNAPWADDGKLNRYFDGWDEWETKIQNPLYEATLGNMDKSGYVEIINNLSVEWKMTSELTLRGKFGISHTNNTSDRYKSPESSEFKEYAGDQVLRKGRYVYTSGEANTYEGNVTLSYAKVLGDVHSLYAGLDASIAQKDSHSYGFTMEGFTNDRPFLGNALGYAENGMPSASESTTRRLGVVGNVNYVYDNRYYVDLSLRSDGSSQFGANKRFGTFWSAGLGWNVHKEHFWGENQFLNTLRLRLSYGETGSQKFSAYQALPMFKYYDNDRYAYWGGAYLMGLGNEDLKWQVTAQYNAGMEFTVWNNRLKGSLDVYSKLTNNLLSAMDIPLATGFSSYMENIGKVKNTGFEVSLSGFVVRNTERKMSLMLSGKLAYNKNEITKLSDDLKRQTAEMLMDDVDVNTLYYEGRSQNSIYAVRSLGIDPSSGKEIFLDKDGEPTFEWKPSAKVYMGVNNPLYQGNAGVMFAYKGVTLNLSFGFHWGGKQYNSTLLSKVEVTPSTIKTGNVDNRVWAERWMKEGDRVYFKGISNESTRMTSRFVMSDNVFSLQSASVQYDLNVPYLQKWGVQNMRFSLNMSDLFYLSSVKRERGTSYPFARNVGLNISLLF